MKETSIVLVTYNAARHIKYCLESVFSQDYKDYEVIIVDNASDDGTQEILKKNYSGLTFIENKNNLGPAKARNQGIAESKGRFILCIDHDCMLPQNFLSCFINVINNNKNTAAVGPKILLSDNKTIYSCGIKRSFLWRFHDINMGKFDIEDNLTEKKVFGVSSAVVLYRREALESIKYQEEYFDEDIFYLFEDVDISWRLQKKGWQILFAPQIKCLHASGASRDKSSFSQYLCLRNRYLIIFKNESFFKLLKFPLVFIIYDLWRNLIIFFANPGYFLKAFYELARLTPKMLRKRRYA